jgi:hypothetical protein
MPTQKLPFPIRGVNRSVSPSRFPEGYALNAKNVMPFDATEGRVRGGQRAGTSRAIQNQVNGLNRVQGMQQITLAAGAASGVDFTTADEYADLDVGWALPSIEAPSWFPFADPAIFYPSPVANEVDRSRESPIAGLLDRNWDSLSSFDRREWYDDRFVDISRVSQPVGNGVAVDAIGDTAWMGATPGPDYTYTVRDLNLYDDFDDGSGIEFEIERFRLLFAFDPNALEFDFGEFEAPSGAAFSDGIGRLEVSYGGRVLTLDDAPGSAATFNNGVGFEIDDSNAGTYGLSFINGLTGSRSGLFDVSLQVRNGGELTVFVNGVEAVTGEMPLAERTGNQVGWYAEDTTPGGNEAILPIFSALEVTAD